MKEQEAREKWCPFARISEADKCLGTDCMAWRWNKDTMVGSLKTPRASGCPEPEGHCGLAGAK